MKPLNQSERTKAFGTFLLFFCITIAVVVVAVFSSMQVPFKDNQRLKKEKAISDRELNVLVEFDKKMVETARLLDSFQMEKNRFQAEAEVDKNIKAMTSMVSDTSVSDIGVVNAICNRILDNINSLYIAKKQLRDENDKTAVILAREQRIRDLEAEVRQLTDRLYTPQSITR